MFATFDLSTYLDCINGNNVWLTMYQLGLIALSADSIVVADVGAGRHQWDVTIQSISMIFRVSLPQYSSHSYHGDICRCHSTERQCKWNHLWFNYIFCEIIDSSATLEDLRTDTTGCYLLGYPVSHLDQSIILHYSNFHLHIPVQPKGKGLER